MPLPAILMGLAQLAPAILPLFSKSETAAQAAELASGVARSVSGADSDEAALAALRADPALALEYRRAMNEAAIALYQEETKRLEAINETIRAEAASADPYVRRMRPTMGYALIASWAATMFAIVYVMVADPAQAPAVVTAVAQLGMMWSVALSVLGLYVWKRSEDKKPEPAGVGVLSALAQRIAGR